MQRSLLTRLERLSAALAPTGYLIALYRWPCETDAAFEARLGAARGDGRGHDILIAIDRVACPEGPHIHDDPPVSLIPRTG
jgi:hypothetical protein